MTGVGSLSQADDEKDQSGEKKADEVDKIMNRYDQEEQHETFLKSPEYKA